MILCKDGCYAYTGETVSEAYDNYLNATDDTNNLSPHELKWFSVSEMVLDMKLSPKPKVVPKKESKGTLSNKY